MGKVGFGLLLVAFPAALTAAPTAHVLNSNQSIDVVDMATNTDAPHGPVPFSSDSLAVSDSGTLYSADAFGVLWDVTNGQIPVGPTQRTGIGDLVFANNGLWGFSNTSQELFFFDMGLATVTYAQALSTPSGWVITGVAYQASTGDIYLSGYDANWTSYLMAVPSFSSSANLVGTLAHTDGFSYISDIEFDSAGNLFAMTWFHRHFLEVSTLTASTTLLSMGPHRDSTAMAIQAIPEPASSLAFALTIAAAAIRRRRNQGR